MKQPKQDSPGLNGVWNILEGFKAATDLLLPRVCAVCGRKLNLSEEHLCLHCWSELPLTHFWERGHNSMADKFNKLIESGIDSYLTEGRLERYAYASALFFYDGAGSFRKIPHQLKYHANLSLGRKFGRLLGQKLRLAEHLCDVDVVIPVPLHWTRHWKRGYNQAEVIAAEVARVLCIEMRTDILRRSRRTRTQTKVDPRDKSANVTGAFIARITQLNSPETPLLQEVNVWPNGRTMPKCHTSLESHASQDGHASREGHASQDCLSDGNAGYRHILLIDDVFTSGSTLHACFTALRSIIPPSVRISVATLGFVGGA